MDNIVYEENYISGDIGRIRYRGILHMMLKDNKLIVDLNFKPLGRKRLLEVTIENIKKIEIYKARIADDIIIWFQKEDQEKSLRIRSHDPKGWVDVFEKLDIMISGKVEGIGRSNKLFFKMGKIFILVWLILLCVIILSALFIILLT